ncbi:MAG TPA: PQQ-binding-like beta-propeller repeat protein, partial [Candidatus Saccharimonadales bacterium]|nr:PQQ-binding-like beta-propeller repeat protein [Candidatus Saccharimonadales bacterium]
SAPLSTASDWPQLARDAGRTAHASASVAPPYRARWIWCGPSLTLRNRAANPSWPDDLGVRTKPGADYPLPEKVSFTFAGRAQPVVASGKVFIGDVDGRIYALSLDDGRTLWTADNPGGTCAALAVAGDVVVATSMRGAAIGFDSATGRRLWRVETAKAITGAPLVLGTTVFSGCHDGRMYAIDASSGKIHWTSTNLGAPIVSELCGDTNAIYVGAENMFFHKLDPATGKVLAKTRLNGQSFRLLHPVLHIGFLFVQTVQPICVGSEYVMENVMRDSPDIATEQTNILRWLNGDTNGGQWRDASPAWKHLFVLRSGDLTEPFTVLNGPADGCGSPAPPPVIDGDGRVLAWFKTGHPTLTAKGSFGTRYSMDISAIDLKTGLRLPIDNGHLSGTTGETDNLFALSSGGSLLYLRQRFRGTKVIDLKRSTSHMIQAAVRTRDGGTWPADVVYRNTGELPRCSQPALGGREAVVIAGDKLLFAEEYCITCVEHREP